MTSLHRSEPGLLAPDYPRTAAAAPDTRPSWMDWSLGRRIAVAVGMAAGLWTSVAWALAGTP